MYLSQFRLKSFAGVTTDSLNKSCSRTNTNPSDLTKIPIFILFLINSQY